MPKANTKNTNSRSTKHAKESEATKTPSARSVADPIYAAIDRHVAAYKKYDAAITVTGRLEGRRGKHKPGFAVAERKQSRLCDSERSAHKTISTTRAKTIEGAAAAALYLRALYIDDGCEEPEFQALDAFVRMTGALAPRAHSTDFLKVKAIVKRIEGERAKRHARAVKWRKSAAGKKAMKMQELRTKKLKKEPTAAEVMGQRKAIAIMRGFLAAIEPDQPKAKTKKLAKAA